MAEELVVNNREWNQHQRHVDISKKMKNTKVVGIQNHGHDVSDEKDLLIPHVIEPLENLS